MKCGLVIFPIVFAIPTPAFAQGFDDAAFQLGSGQSGIEFRLLITSVFHASLLLLAAWIIFCLVREWMDGNLGQRQLLINTTRTIALVMLLGVFIR